MTNAQDVSPPLPSINVTLSEVEALNSLAKKFFQNSYSHGFYVNDLNIHEKLMLIVGEVSEAHEELRSGHGPRDVYYSDAGKPEGLPTELADIIIRTLDLAEALGIDIGAVLDEKHEFNVRRPYMHDRKF